MKELSIAHIINPVIVPKSSDLYIAQPITFETMKLAKAQADGKVDVQQFAAFYPEDEEFVPSHLLRTRPLEQSVLDFDPIYNQRKLPLIANILERLYEASDADYFVYTNVDIGLLPHFYLALEGLIRKGYDAFIINRRTITPKEEDLYHLPLLFSEVGKKHPGSDCFVFMRSLYPDFVLGRMNIGCHFIDMSLQANYLAHAQHIAHMRDLHLTFHIGNDRVWQQSPQGSLHNMREVENIFSQILDNPHYIAHPDEFNELYQHFYYRKQVVLEQIEGDILHPFLSFLIFVSGSVDKRIRKLKNNNDNKFKTRMISLLVFARNKLTIIKKYILKYTSTHADIIK